MSQNGLSFDRKTDQLRECENCHTIFNMQWLKRIRTPYTNKELDVCPICGSVYFTSGKPTKLVIHETHDSAVPYLIEQIRVLKQETAYFQREITQDIEVLKKNMNNYHMTNKDCMDKLENNIKHNNSELHKKTITVAGDFISAMFEDKNEGNINKK